MIDYHIIYIRYSRKITSLIEKVPNEGMKLKNMVHKPPPFLLTTPKHLYSS